MKEFTTAVEDAEYADENDGPRTYTFMIDGRECTAMRPKDGQLAVLMAANSRHSSREEQVAGLINFFVNVLDEESHAYIVNRLMDHKDPFGLKQVTGIFNWLIEEWSGRPTKQPSVSTTSPPSGGQRSTPTTQRRRASSSTPAIAS